MEKEEEERKLKENDEKKFPSTQNKDISKEYDMEDNMLYTCDLLGDLAMKRGEVNPQLFYINFFRCMRQWKNICEPK